MVSFLNAPHLLFRSHFSFVAPHLIALVMSALALIALYFLLRTSFDSGLSLLGVALLALNPLFIHYSVFALSDMPSMAFITLGFALYLRTQKSAWGFLGAVLSRYTTLLTFGSLLLFELIKGKRIKRFILVSLLALTAFYLIHSFSSFSQSGQRGGFLFTSLLCCVIN
jgi:4-amino-4-deoxy-L-arabinose transferase-like glycosyltransferase